MPQVAVSSTDTRTSNTHSRVTYYEERDAEAYYVTDEELADLCRLLQEQTVSMPNADLIDLIDALGPSVDWRLFM